MTRQANRYPEHPVVVVDDETLVLQSISASLASRGITNIRKCEDARGLFSLMESEHEAAAILLDLMMPGMAGSELVREVRQRYPDVPVIVVTGAADVSTAVECMKLGVFDYLSKAIDEARLLSTVTRAVEWRELADENARLRKGMLARELRTPEAFADIVFSDQRMLSVFLYVESVAVSSQTILVTGETGVGKELVAQAIHRASGRAGDFVPVNVAGYDDAMFADALFGHVAGAYTGAATNRGGLIAQAKGGTLLLDEIGDLSAQSQVKLLRLLESREYYPLGSDSRRRSDARVLVSTNVDLSEAIASGRFRGDLYYRLETHHVHIPALRQRKDDIPPLVRHFMGPAGAEYRKQINAVTGEALDAFDAFNYPGNVRELRALVFDSAGRDSDGVIDVDDLPERLSPFVQPHGEAGSPRPGLNIAEGGFPTLRQATDYLISEALKRTNGNQTEAARLLGISAPALSRRLSRRDRNEEI